MNCTAIFYPIGNLDIFSCTSSFKVYSKQMVLPTNDRKYIYGVKSATLLIICKLKTTSVLYISNFSY